MTLRLPRVVAAGALMLAAATAGAQVNVAAGKAVTLLGTFGVLRPGSPWAPAPAPAAASTITDGIYRPEGTTWTNATVWWDASVAGSETNSIVIDLGQVFHITGVSIQADNNDQYPIDFRVGAADPWINLGYATACCGAGMRTRSGGVSLDASQFRLRAQAGDQYYAISEFQAYSPVPEPATLALVGGGLAVVGVAARRRRQG